MIKPQKHIGGKNMVVCMHHNDLDGRCAAALVVRSVNDKVSCFEVDYRSKLPIEKCKGQEVYIVDFTPPNRKQFEKLVEVAEKVIWIDHHQSNIEEYPEFDNTLDGLRADTNPSGAGLTWKYFHPDEEMPFAVRLTSDYDTWNFNYREPPHLFWAGMNVNDQNPSSKTWNFLLNHNEPEKAEGFAQNILQAGNVILLYQYKWGKDYMKSIGFETTLDGHPIYACNICKVNSHFFIDVIDDYDLVSCFSFDGSQWLVSIYSEKVDCSEIAKKYGGGGHKGASGFTCQELPFKGGQFTKDPFISYSSPDIPDGKRLLVDGEGNAQH